MIKWHDVCWAGTVGKCFFFFFVTSCKKGKEILLFILKSGDLRAAFILTLRYTEKRSATVVL